MFHKDSSFVCLMNRNDKNFKRLVTDHGSLAKCFLMRDGSYTIFLSSQRGESFSDVCIINKNCRKIRNLTKGLNYINQNPQLSPDEKSIIFASIFAISIESISRIQIKLILVIILNGINVRFIRLLEN